LSSLAVVSFFDLWPFSFSDFRFFLRESLEVADVNGGGDGEETGTGDTTGETTSGLCTDC